MKTIISLQLFLIAISVTIIGCHFSDETRSNNINGYIKKYDTVKNSNSSDMKQIFRTFYQKTPTINNGFIQIKECMNDQTIYVSTNEKSTSDTVSFRIPDFDTFLNQTDYVINSNLNNITIALDSLEQTYIRKSLSFEKGIFLVHNYEENKNILFDLSLEDVKIIKQAYNKYLKE